MNERIQELIRLADVHILPDDSEYGHCIIGLEKFAELIVREVFEIIDDEASYTIYAPVVQLVKEQFGINDE